MSPNNQQKQKTVFAFGETLWDLLPSGPVLGGAPFNFAYRVHELGDRGLMVSRLGRDDHGDRAFQQVEAWGMSTRFIQRDEQHPTGTVQVSFDSQNLPQYFITPGVAYDYTEITEELLVDASSADCFCYGTLAQRTPEGQSTLRRLLESSKNAVKLLDINLRKECFTEEIIRQSIGHATVLKLNEEEARHLADLYGIENRSLPEFSREMIRRGGLATCIITLGERGSFAASGDQQVYTPGYRVEVADSCGSGDAFTAGYVYCLLRGRDLWECAELGNAMGALVASQRGATVPIKKEAIQEFLLSGSERIWDESLEKFAIFGKDAA